MKKQKNSITSYTLEELNILYNFACKEKDHLSKKSAANNQLDHIKMSYYSTRFEKFDNLKEKIYDEIIKRLENLY